MRIQDITPETLSDLVGPGVASLFEKAIKDKIHKEFDKLVEEAAQEVCTHIKTFVESCREIQTNKFVINLIIEKKK